MNEYSVTLKIVAYSEVTVKARNREEAEAEARKAFNPNEMTVDYIDVYDLWTPDSEDDGEDPHAYDKWKQEQLDNQ